MCGQGAPLFGQGEALLTEDQSQALLILSAAPRTEASEKLALLRVLGHEQFASPITEA